MDALIKSERTGNLFDEPYCDDDDDVDIEEDENEETQTKEESSEKRKGKNERCCSKHLFLREKKEYEWEARCFWSHGRLTGNP